MNQSEYAARRAREAWEARIKHVNAAQNWTDVAQERPEHKRVSEVLAKWMLAYADADAAAERAFTEIEVTEAIEAQRAFDPRAADEVMRVADELLKKHENPIAESVVGSSVRTTTRSPDADREYDPEARKHCKWGVTGVVVRVSDAHGLCFEVKHEDGTTAFYEPNELEKAS